MADMDHHDGIERLVPGVEGDEGLLQRHLAGYAHIVKQAGSVGRVLDCGCGVGYGAHLLGTHCGPTIGLDRDLETLTYGCRHYPAALSYICGDGLQLPFADNTFDLIVVSQVLEHFADPDSFCGELIRVCRDERPHESQVRAAVADLQLAAN